MDYKLTRRYFSTVNWVMVAIVLLLSIGLFYIRFLYGVIPALAVAAYVFIKLYDLPKEAEIDAIYLQASEEIVEQGYQKLGIISADVGAREPLLLHGPIFDPIRYDPAIKKGQDKQVRSSNYQATVFYFGKEQVHIYQKSFSVIDDEQNEVVDAYFYNDIVSLAMASDMTPYYNELLRRDAFVNLDRAILHTKSSQALSCAVKDLKASSADLYRMKDFLGIRKK